MTGLQTEATEDLVGELLRDQHPGLPDLPLREVDCGWGDQRWRLRGEPAVRVPREDPDAITSVLFHCSMP